MSADRPTDLAGSWNRAIDAANAEIDLANAAADRRERCLDLHGYGCARAECGRAPVRESDIRGIAEYIGPAPYAGVDRSSAPESLQHVAEPRPLDAALIRAAGAAMLRSGRESPLDLAPATSADLLELDAVPDPVDSDAPRAAFSADEPTQRNRRTERP